MQIFNLVDQNTSCIKEVNYLPKIPLKLKTYLRRIAGNKCHNHQKHITDLFLMIRHCSAPTSIQISFRLDKKKLKQKYTGCF